MPARASEQIWPNQFWLPRFQVFRHFFDVAMFSQSGACVAGQASHTGWDFLRARKKSAFNVGFARFAPESKSPFMASHEVRVYVLPPWWGRSWCRTSLLVLGVCGFFLRAFLSLCGFFKTVFFHPGFCRQSVPLLVRWATPLFEYTPLHNNIVISNIIVIISFIAIIFSLSSFESSQAALPLTSFYFTS